MTVHSRFAARLGGAFARVATRLRGFGSNTRGAIAVWVALSILPLSILVFGVVDVSRMSLERRRLQDALDAATLIAARTTATDESTLTATGSAALKAELGSTTATSKFYVDSKKEVIGEASISISPIILGLINNNQPLVTSAKSYVVRSSKNLEVALVLDITGSMDGTSRIGALKTAAADLIDTVVQDVQTPYYSKAAIVPYSIGVNVSTYADNVRGAIPSSTLSSAAWYSATKTISAYTKGSPTTITTSATHGLAVGDYVYITGTGSSYLNAKILAVTSVPSTTTFKVTPSSSITSAGSAGTIYKCLTSTCSVVITTAATHNFQTGDQVLLSGISGMTALNSKTPTITYKTTTTFDTNIVGTSYTTAGTGGTGSCYSTSRSDISCAFFNFTSASSTSESFPISTCATERTGTYAYTDDAPSTSLVGRNYPASTSYGASSTNPCPTSVITPLSTDKTALKAQINALAVGGSTAGQIGLAWGWYMVSPNFSYLWPNTSQKPAAYGAEDLMKVVVLMTDGAFNTNYCKGVIAKDAGSGSGGTADHINCAATNGDAFTQAQTLCTKMKAKNVIIYTVGFDVGSDATAKSMLSACATSSDYAYFPANATELKTAFKAISQQISALRIAQ
ncbi:pilus assembly protein TadG [Caulobacter sp. D4A]|uniref:TadE/TadG family type IV pilus assembly protein n=1 Tax=unclassified Caulobacter TaxID=2648921 RepID=UPI000D73C570|nr:MULTISPECIES: TadE/TadG family type IV pilus assembly protein [unclassified Caulobacter]PXA86982.1 pilus assembly protein TadG [Caulobacter sp. D4A]PXA91416.1 pilus assembly protein TadG [Caulobacter sp. D5]